MSRSENIHGNLLLLNVKFIFSDGDPKVKNESKKCEQNHTTTTFLVLAACGCYCYSRGHCPNFRLDIQTYLTGSRESIGSSPALGIVLGHRLKNIRISKMILTTYIWKRTEDTSPILIELDTWSNDS